MAEESGFAIATFCGEGTAALPMAAAYRYGGVCTTVSLHVVSAPLGKLRDRTGAVVDSVIIHRPSIGRVGHGRLPSGAEKIPQ